MLPTDNVDEIFKKVGNEGKKLAKATPISIPFSDYFVTRAGNLFNVSFDTIGLWSMAS